MTENNCGKCDMKCQICNESEQKCPGLSEDAIYACLIPCEFIPNMNKPQNNGCGTCQNNSDKNKTNGDETKTSKRNKKEAKEVELRSSILYVGCECEKRNGMQDQCRRTGCQGAPECLTIPPTCGPSKYANGKHLVKVTQPTKPEHIPLLPQYKYEGEDDYDDDDDNAPKQKKKTQATICPMESSNCGQKCDKCCKDKKDKKKKEKNPEVFIGPVNISMPSANISYGFSKDN